MELKLNNPKTFNIIASNETTCIALPSAGFSLTLDEEEHNLFKDEVSRFLKETIFHSSYVVERFAAQQEYLNSHIDSLIHENLWDLSGFTETALDTGGSSFKFEAENILEFMPSVFTLNADLVEFSSELPIKTCVTKFLPQWPSIEKASTLSFLPKNDWAGKWDVPIRFTSSGRLAGLFKPTIFHDGSFEISLNEGKAKLFLKKEDARKLLDFYFTDEERREFDVAEKAWKSLSDFENKIRKFIKCFYENGFEKDTQCFSLDSVNIDGIHKALKTLKFELESEAH